MQGFIQFIRTQGVVGLATGFILGGAVSKVVASFVNDIVNPMIGIALGAAGGLKETVVSVAGVNILIGSFISTAIDFIIVAGVVYFGFKWLKLDRLDIKK